MSRAGLRHLGPGEVIEQHGDASRGGIRQDSEGVRLVSPDCCGRREESNRLYTSGCIYVLTGGAPQPAGLQADN